MRRSLIYRVEQLFLLHRDTNQWLLHVAGEPGIAEDSANVAATLREIQDFARDFFLVTDDSGLEEFPIGEKRVCIALGRHAYLAAVIGGHSREGFRVHLQETIERIHIEHGAALAGFSGDASGFKAVAADITPCLRAEYKPLPEIPRLKGSWAITAAAIALLLLLGAGQSIRSAQRWRDFLVRLKSEPGILVAASERHWFAPSRVVGLRDPLAADPAAIAREAKLNPARLRFEWQEYSATDPVIVQRRFAQREAPGSSSAVRRGATVGPDDSRALEHFKAAFKPPPTVKAVVVANGVLVLSGTSPYEWISAVHAGGMSLPGITAIKGDDLVVEFEPKLVLKRFREQFGMPDGVDATLGSGRLILSGAAPHGWLDRVRRGALLVPGVRLLDDQSVEDIDQRTFHEAKSALEDAVVLFVLSRDSLPPGSEAALARLADETRRCFTAAANMGVNASLELRGYGDAVATELENAELSRRRAEAVRDLLKASGVDGVKLNALGMGTPPAGPGQKPGAGKFDRGVFFRVVIQP